MARSYYSSCGMEISLLGQCSMVRSCNNSGMVVSCTETEAHESLVLAYYALSPGCLKATPCKIVQ